MKLDFIFLMVVIITGLSGLYLYTQGTDDYLSGLKRQAATKKTQQPSLKRQGIAKSKISRSRFSGSKSNNNTEKNERPELDIAMLNQEAIAWSDLYRNWKRSILENVSDKTELKYLNSVEACRIGIGLGEDDVKLIELAQANVTRQSGDIIIRYKQNQELLLKNIYKPFVVLTQTEQIISFCSLQLTRQD